MDSTQKGGPQARRAAMLCQNKRFGLYLDHRHPIEALALNHADSPRFCEWLDATEALSSGWPHSTWSARQWLCRACGISSLGELGTSRRAAQAWREIHQRFLEWSLNQELDL